MNYAGPAPQVIVIQPSAQQPVVVPEQQTPEPMSPTYCTAVGCYPTNQMSAYNGNPYPYTDFSNPYYPYPYNFYPFSSGPILTGNDQPAVLPVPSRTVRRPAADQSVPEPPRGPGRG